MAIVFKIKYYPFRIQQSRFPADIVESHMPQYNIDVYILQNPFMIALFCDSCLAEKFC